MEAEVAARDIEKEEAALAQAALEVRAAELAVDRMRIIAPMNGIITERLLAEGEYHDSQTPVLHLADIGNLRIEAYAPISHAGRLHLGQDVLVHPEEPIGGSWPAVITVIDQVFDAATATFGFRMEMPNPDLVLPAGLRCEVEFIPDSDD